MLRLVRDDCPDAASYRPKVMVGHNGYRETYEIPRKPPCRSAPDSVDGCSSCEGRYRHACTEAFYARSGDV